MTTDNELVELTARAIKEALRKQLNNLSTFFPEAKDGTIRIDGVIDLKPLAAAALEAADTIQTRGGDAKEDGRPVSADGQPAGAPTGLSPQAVSGKAAHQAQEDQSVCMDCGGLNPVWFAPNALWNLVIGGPEAKGDPGGFYCPICFIVRAEAAGIKPTAWVLTQERIGSEERVGEVARIIDPEAFAFKGDGDSYKAKFEIPARKRAATDKARAVLAASPPTPQVDAGEVLRVLQNLVAHMAVERESLDDHGFLVASAAVDEALTAARSLADKLGREG